MLLNLSLDCGLALTDVVQVEHSLGDGRTFDGREDLRWKSEQETQDIPREGSVDAGGDAQNSRCDGEAYPHPGLPFAAFNSPQQDCPVTRQGIDQDCSP